MLQCLHMRVPYRKPGKFTNLKPDPNITPAKKAELEADLERLKKKRPHAAKEVQLHAQNGDFSENAEYQLAKRRLRGINCRILELEDHLKRAIVIEKSTSDAVALGDTVTITMDGEEKTYTILGPSETDPNKNIISHLSPIGSALVGKTSGDEFELEIAGKTRQCVILAKQ